jgi:hypothetical protein
MQLTVAERKVNPFSYTKVVIIRLIDFFFFLEDGCQRAQLKETFCRKVEKKFSSDIRPLKRGDAPSSLSQSGGQQKGRRKRKNVLLVFFRRNVVATLG